MSDGTSIEWTDSTWNPVRGCTKVSPGCKNCYAERFAERFRGVKGHPFEQGFDLRLVPEKLDEPLRWREPRRVFVNSMSDLFHGEVPDAFIEQVFAVMALAEQHTFQVLTKRPERMRAFFTDDPLVRWACIEGAAQAIWAKRTGEDPSLWLAVHGPLKNVMLGVSVENQAAADERIPHLLATPAAVRFLSCEPLIGPVDLSRWLWADLGVGGRARLNALGWVIVGGESGPKARPCAEEWIRSIVEQCRAAGVPVFVKQLGAYLVSEGRTAPATTMEHPEQLGRDDFAPNGEAWAAWRAGLRDRKGGDPAEWPVDLRVRDFPRST